MKDRKGVGPNGMGGAEEPGKVERGKTITRIYYVRK